VNLLDSWKKLFLAFNSRQKAAAGAIAVLSAAALWLAVKAMNSPSMTVLADGSDGEQRTKILAQLNAKGIPSDIDQQGRISVPAEKVDEARLVLAQEGGSKSARLGFELFDKPNWTNTEFDEKINYQRALEGELQQTISTMSQIESARVHIVLPEYSLYEQHTTAAKAAVIVGSRSGKLEKSSVQAIVSLVSSSVPGLAPEAVSIVDTAGNSIGDTSNGTEKEAEAESLLQQKLVSTLEPVVGAGRVKVAVVIERQSAEVLSTEEAYDKASAVPLSMQRSEQRSAPPLTGGVAGASANLGAGTNQTGSIRAVQEQSASSETGTYGVNRTTRRTAEPAGRVKRMSVAVVVDDGHHSRSNEEVKSLRDLAAAAIGIDTQRGDTLEVQSLSFATDLQTPVAGEGNISKAFRLATRAMNVIRVTAIGLIFIVFCWLVLRPLAKEVSSGFRAATAALASAHAAGESARNRIQPELHAIADLKATSLQKLVQEPKAAYKVVSGWLKGQG